MPTRIKPEPLTRADAERLVAEITSASNYLRLATANQDAEIQTAKEKYAAAIEILKKEISQKSKLVQVWADENPDAFGRGRSIKFSFGRIGFRTGMPSLVLLSKKWNWEKVLESVEKILPNFIRQKPEVDREAILNQREELAEFLPLVGLKVSQGETFFIEPDLTKVETNAKAAA